MCRPEETNVKWCLVPLILAFSSSRTIPTDSSKSAPSQRWQRRMSCCLGTRLLSDVFSRPFSLWQKYHLKRITGVCYSRRGLQISEVFQLTKLSKAVNIGKSQLFSEPCWPLPLYFVLIFTVLVYFFTSFPRPSELSPCGGQRTVHWYELWVYSGLQ